MINQYYPFVNEPLPYAYNALEPYIDEKTMYLHHDKHLQTYINNLNTILKGYPQLQRCSLEQLIVNLPNLPKDLQAPIRNNSGGVYNHLLYFNQMSPQKTTVSDTMAESINKNFGSFEDFKGLLKKTALSVFGSGYAWLVYDNGKLKIVTTPNQNTPLEQNLCPLIALDVWEHAYYLKHYNLRADYIDDWFNVINWDEVNQRYLNCIK
ncbi:MAG: superoxide dismutase [Clostridiales bacterium]|nr:MAG: superoxide dismutase [Clostridiales bacterium]